MALGQAEEGRGAFGGGCGRHGSVRGLHVVMATVFVSRLQRAGLPFQEGRVAALFGRLEVLAGRGVSSHIGTSSFRPQVEIKLGLSLCVFGAEEVGKVVVGQVFAARCRAA